MNRWAWQFSKMQYTAKMNGWTPFVSMQNLHNALYRWVCSKAIGWVAS